MSAGWLDRGLVWGGSKVSKQESVGPVRTRREIIVKMYPIYDDDRLVRSMIGME